MKKDLLREMERSIPLEVLGNNILCAVSGGPDSMFLLYALKELAKKHAFFVYAIHINHQIREEEAQRDEQFVADICSKWSIPCEIFSVDVPQIAKKERISLETAGRNVRRNACLKVAQQYDCKLIALGHHANDQAETVLMNLLRGSGANGLSGMQEYSGLWWRPMLGFLRKDIEQAVEQYQIPFIIDSTNTELRFTRNRFRKTIADLEKEQPQATEHIVRAATFIAEDDTYLQEVAIHESRKIVSVDGINVLALRQLAPSIAKRILQNTMKQYGLKKDISYQHIQALWDGCQKDENHSWSLPNNCLAILEYNQLKFQCFETTSKYDVCIPLDPIHDTITPWGRFHYLRENVDLESMQATDILSISTSMIQHACIRSRRVGDRIMLKGMQGHKKIKDFFIDRKIPKSSREGPLLAADANGSDILWIVGYAKDKRCVYMDSDSNVNQCRLAFFSKKVADINNESGEVNHDVGNC